MYNNKIIYLSYLWDEKTVAYGNRNKFFVEKKSSILNNNIANDTHIYTIFGIIND